MYYLLHFLYTKYHALFVTLFILYQIPCIICGIIYCILINMHYLLHYLLCTKYHALCIICYISEHRIIQEGFAGKYQGKTLVWSLQAKMNPFPATIRLLGAPTTLPAPAAHMPCDEQPLKAGVMVTAGNYTLER